MNDSSEPSMCDEETTRDETEAARAQGCLVEDVQISPVQKKQKGNNHNNNIIQSTGNINLLETEHTIFKQR